MSEHEALRARWLATAKRLDDDVYWALPPDVPGISSNANTRNIVRAVRDWNHLASRRAMTPPSSRPDGKERQPADPDRCPDCGGKSLVINSRPRGTHRWRIRRCVECSAMWDTYESVISPDDILPEYLLDYTPR